MSLQRTKAETTASEFSIWCEYLKREILRKLEPNAEHYYFAQIAAEVRRSFVKKSSAVKLSDFILKFESGKPKAVTKEKRTKTAKNFWLGMFGIKE